METIAVSEMTGCYKVELTHFNGIFTVSYGHHVTQFFDLDLAMIEFKSCIKHARPEFYGK